MRSSAADADIRKNPRASRRKILQCRST